MSETPKEKRENCDEAQKDKAWADDQQTREYYYDDAHGYEKYDPDAEDQEPEVERTTPSAP